MKIPVPRKICIVLAGIATLPLQAMSDSKTNDVSLGKWAITSERDSSVTSICSAMVVRLNQKPVTDSNFCDIDEVPEAKGFDANVSKQLSMSEFEQIFPQLTGFMAGQDPLLNLRRHLEDLESCRDPKGRACQQAQKSIARSRSSQRELFKSNVRAAYKFDPELDVDNDGQPDPIVRLKQFDVPPNRTRPEVLAFVTDPTYQYIDTERTKMFFQDRSRVGNRSGSGFNSIGPIIGFWSYRGLTYTLICGRSREVFPSVAGLEEEPKITVLRAGEVNQKSICEFKVPTK